MENTAYLYANSPDIAYYPGDQHWYAVVTTADPANSANAEVRILRATTVNTLTGSWDVVGAVTPAMTANQQNHNPGLAKNADSTLYVDAGGWAYVLFGTGANRPNTATWDIGQARFKPGP